MQLYRQATEVTSEALASPSKYLNLYGDFVTKNASAVGQIEGALRSLTYIIPGRTQGSQREGRITDIMLGRFRDAEIASESRTLLLKLMLGLRLTIKQYTPECSSSPSTMTPSLPEQSQSFLHFKDLILHHTIDIPSSGQSTPLLIAN